MFSRGALQMRSGSTARNPRATVSIQAFRHILGLQISTEVCDNGQARGGSAAGGNLKPWTAKLR